MSAELLRRAASEIRTEQRWNEHIGRIDADEHATWLAVANWLDEIAWWRERDLMPAADDGEWSEIERHALTVARAYLGDNT